MRYVPTDVRAYWGSMAGMLSRVRSRMNSINRNVWELIGLFARAADVARSTGHPTLEYFRASERKLR